jgi:hypothetical protein
MGIGSEIEGTRAVSTAVAFAPGVVMMVAPGSIHLSENNLSCHSQAHLTGNNLRSSYPRYVVEGRPSGVLRQDHALEGHSGHVGQEYTVAECTGAGEDCTLCHGRGDALLPASEAWTGLERVMHSGVSDDTLERFSVEFTRAFP